MRLRRTLTCVLFLACMASDEAEAQIETWRISPSWRVSVGDGPGSGHEFLWVRDATLLNDGRIVVLSGGTHDLRVFTPTGEFIRSVGRAGEGPGEFGNPGSLRLLDSGELVVYDGINARLTWFAPGWEVSRTERVGFDLSAGLPAPGRLRPMIDGRMPIVRIDRSMREAFSRPEGVHEDSLLFSVHDGNQLRTVARRAKGPTYFVRIGTAGLTKPLPFGKFALYAAGPNEFVFGSSHDTTFEVVGADGGLLRTMEASGEPRRATREDWARFEDRFRRENGGSVSIRGMASDLGPRAEEILRDAPRGDLVPLFDFVALDDHGRLWIREYVLGPGPATWQIVVEGRGLIARLEMPVAWTVLEFGEDYLLVLERDELDVEMVRLYDLIT